MLPNHTPTTKVEQGVMGGGVVGETAGEEWSKRTEEIQLQDRDLNIFSCLEIWGIMGLGQIEGACFSGDLRTEKVGSLLFNEGYGYKSAAYGRLRRLIREGYLAVQKFYGQAQVYGLTEKGHKTLKSRGMAELPTFLKETSPATAHHKLLTAGAGLLASRVLGLPVLSERQLYFIQRNRQKTGKWTGGLLLPDLLIPGSDRKAIEVELHQKKEEKYRWRWESYRRKLRGRGQVLYLVPRKSRMNGLLELSGKCGAGFVYALDIPTFQESLGRAAFLNSKGESLFLQGVAA